MYTFFISCSSKDYLPVSLCDELEPRGAKCWISPRDIPKGMPYARAIMKGIENSEIFVVCISANSLKSEDVLNEIDNASKLKKTIIPVFIENVTLNLEFSYYLNRRQWIRMSNLPDCVSELLEVIGLKTSTNNSIFSLSSDIKTGTNPSLIPPLPFPINYLITRLNNPVNRNAYGKFLMPVEDIVPIHGRGVTVRGKIDSGKASVGDKVWVCGSNQSTATLILGIEKSRLLYERAVCGEDCGMLLSIFDTDCVERGMILSDDASTQIVTEFFAAVYLFKQDECETFYPLSLTLFSQIEINNKCINYDAEIMGISEEIFSNGDYCAVKFKIDKGIYVENDDLIALRYNDVTVGYGLVYGL